MNGNSPLSLASIHFFLAMLCELRGICRVKYGNIVIPMMNSKRGRTCLLSHRLSYTVFNEKGR